MPDSYDSRPDTLEHIRRVQTLLSIVCNRLMERAIAHDASKLTSPEVEVFDVVTPRLRALTYGSDEYKASLAEMKPALDHHYAHNSHHPEHYGDDGVFGMDLLDVIEMFCDWWAATERHADGNLLTSIEKNQERFHYSPDLLSVMRNTAVRMGYEPPAPRLDV